MDRSENMRRIRSKDTAPELLIRRIIFKMGYRYRLHYAKLPGRPDLVFPSRKKVIFIHGCFWHKHEKCKISRMPKSNIKYWKTKLNGNKKRDAGNQDKLKKLGWLSMVLWECQLEYPGNSIKKKIKKFLR
ncbi:MAG: DNA mismatch endonuclease Vsr [Deltaproteobacteria bacterium]|nr:DNA mismatch endonuclease Vsr [Deltaproteobacteria bacterium]